MSHIPACHKKSPQHAAYVARVEELEAKGCTTSDAQDIADMEFDGLLTQPKKPTKPNHKMKLYIYSNETNEHVATITGATNTACEEKAEETYGSNDYSWTYSQAFGFGGGLLEENDDAEEIEA